MFDSSKSEVFTGMLAVAIEGRVVKVGAEEDKPEGAEAIEADQGSDTMKKLFSNMKFLSQNTWEDETEKRKKNREYKSLKNSVENYLIEYNT